MASGIGSEDNPAAPADVEGPSAGQVAPAETLLDHIRDMIFAMDREGRLTFLNRAARDYLAVGQANLVGTPFGDLAKHWAFRATVQQILDRTLEHGLWRGTLPWPTQPGEVRSVDLSTWQVTDAEGRASGVVGIVTDDTDRRRAHDQLRESEELLRGLIDATPDPIRMTGADGGWLACNRAWRRLFGLESVVWKGKTSLQLGRELPFHRRMLEADWHSDQAVWSGREQRREQASVPSPDGADRIFDAIKVPLFHGKGQRWQMVTIAREITEQTRAQRELAASERKLRTIFHGVRDAILIVDREFRTLDANEAVMRLIGADADEARRISLADDLVDEPVGRELLADLCQIALAGGLASAEIRIRRVDAGPRIDVELVVAPIVIEEQDAFVCVLHDVTARKRIEREERQYEKRVLRMRSDRLRSLGQMAAGIAHELNQPLQGIRIFAERLLVGIERGWDVDEAAIVDTLRRVIEQADRMTHIMGHIRLFAREAGRPLLQRTRLNEVALAASDLLRAQFGARGIELVTELADVLPDTLANPYSLEEVLINLLTNARDAVEERMSREPGLDGPRVSLRTRQSAPEPDGEARLLLEVEDTGIGMSGEVLANVFDPFFTTKEPDKGTGLGLTVSNSIVEQLGGKITIDSRSGRGTTVRVLLPAAGPEEEAS